MHQFGLLGQNLSYSYSKKIHEAFGLYDYQLFEVQPEGLDDFFKNRTWKGINVTTPYKRDVQKYVDEETPIAQRVGAINTIYEQNGKLIGDNTDFYGFLHLLNLAKAKTNGKKVLILGRGGAAKCVREAMKERHAGVIWQTHRHELKDLSKMADAEIIVNTTPLGTAKTELKGQRPCNLKKFKKCELVIDLVYNPKETPLLKQAKDLGIQRIGGIEMLKFQAEKAAHRFMLSQNIVLIGMPGSGKSHIARNLADKTGRKFLDTDLELKALTGEYAESLLRKYGEQGFRDLEHKVFAKLLSEENAIISTGGGIVSYEANKELFKDVTTVWLQRDLKDLATSRRPLSRNIKELYKLREPLYEELADIIVENNGAPEKVVSEIKKVCKI